MATPVEIMKIVEFVISNLTSTNLNVMAKKIVALNIKTDWLLDSITRIIHNKALNNSNYTKLYAQLCALVVKDQKSKTLDKSKKTFLTSLVPKCRELLYSYKTNIYTRGTVSFKHYPLNIMLANCKFIGELYNQGILIGKTMRSIIDELITERGDIQVNCLFTILTSIGPHLAKIYDIPKLFDYLRWVERNQYHGKIWKTLINDIRILHFKWSIRRDIQELIVGQQPSVSRKNYVKVTTSPDEKSSVESLHKCIDECIDLLLDFKKIYVAN